jgi:hypothetical protein
VAASPIFALWAVFVAASLLWLAIFVYSPLHKDDPISTSFCPFCKFEKLTAEPAAPLYLVDFSTLVVWFLVAARPIARSVPVQRMWFGRAPPSFLFEV